MNKIGDTLIHVGSNETLIQALTARDVEFVLIGGLAIAWYCVDRQADDMDLFINPTLENSTRISQCLASLSMSGFQSNSFTKLGLQVPLKQHYYAELLTPKEGGSTYSEVASDALEGKLFNIPIKLASVASLILLKEQALVSASEQVGKHIADINRLKKYAL